MWGFTFMISWWIYISMACNSQPDFLPSVQLSCSSSATQRIFFMRGNERGFDTFMCWDRDNPSASHMAAFLNLLPCRLHWTLVVTCPYHPYANLRPCHHHNIPSERTTGGQTSSVRGSGDRTWRRVSSQKIWHMFSRTSSSSKDCTWLRLIRYQHNWCFLLINTT